MTDSTLTVVTKNISPTTSEQDVTITGKGSAFDAVLVNLIKQISPKADGTSGSQFVYQFDVITAGDTGTANATVKYRQVFVPFSEIKNDITPFFTDTSNTGTLNILKAIPISTNSTGILYHIFYIFNGTGTVEMTLLFEKNSVPTDTLVDQLRFLLEPLGDNNPFASSTTDRLYEDLDKVIDTFTISDQELKPPSDPTDPDYIPPKPSSSSSTSDSSSSSSTSET